MLVRRLETSSCRLVASSAIDRAIKDDVIDEVVEKCTDGYKNIVGLDEVKKKKEKGYGVRK
jgi:hypothetical protein